MGGFRRGRLVPAAGLMAAVGIDLSARRGLDLALLDDRSLVELIHLPDVAATLAWLDALPLRPAIGIDAPQGMRMPLLTDPERRARLEPPPPEWRYRRYRVCDYQLARRGIGLYLSPAAGEPVPEWMAVGFDLFAALRRRGHATPRAPEDRAARLLEVYPFAAFVALIGGIPPRKTTPEGLEARREALVAAGISGLPEAPGHDALDAVAAALTAEIYAAGGGCALGDSEEGLIVLPVAEERLMERYRRVTVATPDGSRAAARFR